jgi:3-oxoacyl-[acyl-carrier-protein] synthase-3
VPKTVQTVEDLAKRFGPQEAEKIAQATGVRARRVGRPGLCCSDLCFAACESLLKELGWERGSVDALLFVSHSFDYPLPATSCLLQARLGLPQSCAAFDVALGCSGYVYGLWIGAGLIAGGCKRVLLLAGEMASRMASPEDRSTFPLFGDAGSATALERAPESVMHFELGTDGGGAQHLIVPAGTSTARVPHSAQTLARTPQADGNPRSDEDLFMNGAEVFVFTLRQVPPLVAAVLQRSQWPKEQVDRFFLHQANRFILVQLARRMGLPLEKVPLVLETYGNTSSASIPLAVTHTARELLAAGKLKCVLAGFGVGLSWGACAVELGPLAAPPLQEVP